MRTTLTATLVALIAVACVACSPTATGNPVPETTKGSIERSSIKEPSAEAPSVDDPLDSSPFLPQPCAVLTEPQLTALNVSTEGNPTTTGSVAENVGPWCAWLAPDQSSSVSIGFLTNNTRGLTSVYNSRNSFDYFEPTTVDGYPGVFAEVADLRDSGTCGIVVGISDTTTFRATEDGTLDARGACDRAKQVAAAALATIRRSG